MRHINNPNFGAVIFRRTSPQITNQGGLWDASSKLYPYLGAKANKTHLTWNFPSGARVRFAHMQHEETKLDWQGSEVPLIGWDELTHFTEGQFFYMLSRNRSTAGMRPYFRCGTNPDAESWVAGFIGWWIDQNTGYAIPERAGRVRWFLRINEELLWADTARELIERYPQYTVDIDTLPKSVTFIPSSVYDNKELLKADPGYLANLLAQPLVERERLLGGNWKIKPSSGKIFNRGWFEIVPAAPAGGEEVRDWDFAATARGMKANGRRNDPDYSAGVKIRKVGGLYFVTHSLAVQEGPAAVDKLLVNTTSQDARRAYGSDTLYRVRWEIEPGSAGIKENIRLAQLLDGYDCRGVRPEGDKIVRSKGFAAQSEAGNVKIAAEEEGGKWIEGWLEHMHNQPDWPHDDIFDASNGAYNDLHEAGEMDQEYAEELANNTGR